MSTADETNKITGVVWPSRSVGLDVTARNPLPNFHPDGLSLSQLFILLGFSVVIFYGTISYLPWMLRYFHIFRERDKHQGCDSE